jgi:hypothetical protein
MHRITAFLLVVLAALGPAIAVAEDAERRDALVGRYLEWRGGERFVSAGSTTRKGTLETSGLTGSIEVVQTRAGRQYLSVDLGVIEVTEVLLPEGSWIVNSSGQVEDMGSVPETNARRALTVEMGLPFLDPGYEIVLLEDEEREGSTWAVLRVAWPDGDYHDLFLDEETGALEWMRVRQDTQVFWTQYGEWDVVDGVRMPQVRRDSYENASRNATFTWAETRLGEPVSEALFERPAATKRVTIAGDADSTGWIPFDFYRRQRIFLEVTVNGVETFAILDSGAEMTALDAKLARAAGLSGSGAVTAEGTGGTAEVQFATGAEIGVANLALRDMTVAVLDLSDLARRLLGRPIPVILGKEVFNELIVDIDYPNRRIAFHDPARWSYQGDGIGVELPELADSRVVEISVEGSEPILASFDIGQGSTLTLFEAYVEHSGLLDGRPASTRRGGGVGGEVISPVTTVRTLAFGGIEFRDVPVSLSIGARGSFDTVRTQGNLGTGVFSRFRMLVNYRDDELYLEPRAEGLHDEFDRNKAGIQLEIGNGRGEVLHVMEGSPAEAAGLAAGDVVTAIDGRAIGNGYWTGDTWRWLHGPEGRTVALTLLDGRRVDLTLATFY